MKDIIKAVGMGTFTIILGVAISFGITSGLVWLFLWVSELVGITIFPAFSWKICIFVYIVLVILKALFGKKEK
jgi:hypothetical protein